MPREDLNRFRDLTFDDFKRLAQDESLSPYEKIGFPNSYREGKEDLIFGDITRKLDHLTLDRQTVMDIGPGCSGLAFRLVDLCRKREHRLVLVDSPEILSHLPDEPFITKASGRFPQEVAWLLDKYAGRVDVILAYSVLYYIFPEANVFDFVDRSMTLLADRGQMLIGDIPNVSKRKRFFSSRDVIRFHQTFTQTEEVPSVQFDTVETGKLDDAVVLSLLLRCRSAGSDAYVLPQAAELPMANRREDLLITKP